MIRVVVALVAAVIGFAFMYLGEAGEDYAERGMHGTRAVLGLVGALVAGGVVLAGLTVVPS